MSAAKSRLNDMSDHRQASNLVCLVSCSVLFTGCTTFRPVPTEQIESEVSAGDTIRVTTDAGAVRQFEVLAVEDGSVLGAGTPIPLGQISKLQKLEANWVGTLGVGAATVLAVVVAATMTIF